jgi:hypothetical protein
MPSWRSVSLGSWKKIDFFLLSFGAQYGLGKLLFYFTNHSKTLNTPWEQNLKTLLLRHVAYIYSKRCVLKGYIFKSGYTNRLNKVFTKYLLYSVMEGIQEI